MKKKFCQHASLVTLLLSTTTAWGQESGAAGTSQTSAERGGQSTQTEQKASPAEAVPVEAPAVQADDPKDADKFDRLMSRPGGLTSDEAAKSAAAYTKEAVIAQASQASARAQKDELVYQYLPKVTLLASYTRRYVPDPALNFGQGSLVATTAAPGPLAATDPLVAIDSSAFNFNPLPNNWLLNAGVTIPISDYLLNFSQALTGAKAATKSAEFNERAARLNAAANARLSYYEWVRSRLQVAEAESSVERAEAQLEDLRNLQTGGRVSRADVLRQDAYLAATELNLRRALTREAVARENLYVLMNGGEGQTPQWEIGEDVLADRPEDDAPLRDVPSLQQEAIQNRLEIQALDQTKYALRQRKTVEQTRGYPRVEGFGNLTYANPNQVYVPPTDEWNGSWDVGVRATWTLNDLGANYSAAKVTKTEITKVEAQKAQIADALRSEVLTAHRSIEEARLAKSTARRGVMAAEAAYTDRTQLFENGRGTTLDVLQAENALLTARVDLIDAYIALRQAKVRLDHAVGWDVSRAQKDGTLVATQN